MKIISGDQDGRQVTIDTDVHPVIMIFKDDYEYNKHLTSMLDGEFGAAIHSGMRIVTLVPKNIELTPLQTAIIDVLKVMDGANGTNKKQNEATDSLIISKLNDILNSLP